MFDPDFYRLCYVEFVGHMNKEQLLEHWSTNGSKRKFMSNMEEYKKINHNDKILQKINSPIGKWNCNIYELYPDFDCKTYQKNYTMLGKLSKKDLELYWMIFGRVKNQSYRSFVIKDSKLTISNNNLCNKIILIQQYYHTNDSNRMKEINEVVELNIKNKSIDEIHLLNEKIYNYPILQNSKIKQININNRLTYKKAFEYANTLDNDTIKILSNSDISFDSSSLQYIKRINFNNVCLALTRYNVISKNPFKYKLHESNHADSGASASQDTWIFTKIDKITDEYNFSMGIPGCDNHLLYLLDKNGVIVKNNALSVITYHHHSEPKRNYSTKLSDRIKNGARLYYKYVTVTK